MGDKPELQAAVGKIRQDLILSRQEQRGTVTFIVKDPATRRFFRFGEPEEFIIRHLDGTHTQEAIQKKFVGRFEAELSAEALAGFVARLEGLGLLDDGTQIRSATPRKSLLYLRFKAFDPDRVLTWLLPRTQLFFTRSFLWLSLSLLFLAITLTLVNSDEIAREAPQLLRGSSLLVTWLAMFVIGCTHEFAHGLTCKRYGGEVREMGFMLLFFMPAFYCNVSDAWLFPKRQRLIVLLAGVHLEILLWAIATIVWRLTPPETFPHLLALIVMGFCGIHTFFNLNPLIKLDGYYLLSDYLEIPNLRAKAFGYLGTRIKNLWGAATQGIDEVTLRERRIYLSYGLLASAYSFFLLGFIALSFGGFLTQTYRGFGFILFTVILMAIFKNPLKKMFLKPLSLFEQRAGRASSFKKPIKYAAALSLLVVVLFAQLELKVAGEFEVSPLHNADVYANVGGIIEEIYVREGDVVKQGQIIARLADREFRAELSKVEAEIAEKRANLNLLKAGARQEEIDLASNQVETAKARQRHTSNRYQESQNMHAQRAARARAALERVQAQIDYDQSYLATQSELFKKGSISRIALDKAAMEVNMRQKELQVSQAALNEILADDIAEIRMDSAVADMQLSESVSKLKLLLAGSRPEAIEATAAEVARLEAQRIYVAEQIRLTELRSPISGIVTTPKLEEKLGQQVNKGDLVAEVFDLTSVIAEIAIPEKEISEVEVGYPVVLKARAFFKEDFEGRVVSIASAVTKYETGISPLEKTVRVTTRIDNSSLQLKPGMTGMAKVYCGQRRLIDILTRRLGRYLRVEFWSYW
jgi:multidrug resistance efflux pump